MRSEEKQTGRLLLAGGLVAAGVAVRPVMYLAAALIVLYTVLCTKKDDVLALLFFLMPAATIFKLNAGSTSLFTYVQLLFELSLLAKHCRHIKKRFFTAYVFYACYVLLGMGTAFSDGIKQIFLPILLYFCLLPEYGSYQRKYAESYALGVVFSSVIGWFMDDIPNMAAFVHVKTERVSSTVSYTRFAGLWGDPNYYSVNLILGFTLIMYFHIKKDIPAWKAVLYYGAFISFGAASGSKMFLIMIVLVLLWFVIELFKARRYFWGTMAVLAGTAACAAVLRGDLTIFDTTIARLLRNRDGLSGLTTNRSDLWLRYLKEFADRPLKFLFGSGLRAADARAVPHNTYIDYLDIYGAAGTLLFLWTVRGTVSRYVKAREIVHYIPLCVLLAMWFALSMMRYLDFGWQLALALLIVYDVNGPREKPVRVGERLEAEQCAGKAERGVGPA